MENPFKRFMKVKDDLEEEKFRQLELDKLKKLAHEIGEAAKAKIIIRFCEKFPAEAEKNQMIEGLAATFKEIKNREESSVPEDHDPNAIDVAEIMFQQEVSEYFNNLYELIKKDYPVQLSAIESEQRELSDNER